jgi:penicillin amidase
MLAYDPMQNRLPSRLSPVSTRSLRDEISRAPPEFGVPFLPATWSPDDVVRIRSNGLWRNLTAEVDRARILCRFPASLDALLAPRAALSVIVPDGVDSCEIPPNVLTSSLAKARSTSQTCQRIG